MPEVHDAGGDATPEERANNPFIPKLSLLKYKVNPKEINRALWGDAGGLKAVLHKRFGSAQSHVFTLDG